MADKSNKVLYIDNITTYDYIKNYMKDHTVDEPNNSKFTYVVFTEYTRPNNYGVSYHGDIFFNGKKITYINDVDVTKSVTDGKDNIIAYANASGGVDFMKSTIKIDNLSNTYELFNVKNAEVSYEYISDLGYVTIERPGKWSYEILSDGGGTVTVSDREIKCSDLTGSASVHLSYAFEINEGSKKKSLTTYAYFNIYNVAKIESVDFGTTPTNFNCGTIYTPRMIIHPDDAAQAELNFTTNSNNIRIINTHTGTFECVTPGSATIICSYNENDNVSHTVYVNKINPHLSLSSYFTTYLWNATNYSSTCCYAHYDPQGMDASGYKWRLNGNVISGGSSTKSPTIRYNNQYLSSSGANIVKFELPEATFGPAPFNTATMQLYAHDQEVFRTGMVTVDVTDNITEVPNTMSFVVTAQTEAGQTGYVNTNYVFGNSIGLTNFVVTNIVVSSNNPSYTYTYVTAMIEPSVINNAYIQNQIKSINAQAIETGQNIDETITCSYIINVQTSDGSFVVGKKQSDMILHIANDSFIHDSVVLNSNMYNSENFSEYTEINEPNP